MNLRFLVSIVAIFATGVATGFFAYSFMKEKPAPMVENASKQVRQVGTYKYINPLLECEVAEGSIDARKENFRDELEKLVVEMKENRNLSDVAIYFRDLDNGPTFGVGEGGEFFPASLLKVPVMMAYYHLAERNPNILNIEVTFEAPVDFGITPTILPREELVPGKSYAIEELIRRMIEYSDNQSLYLLSSRLPIQELGNLFSMLGVNERILTDSKSKLTAKEYAGFFRILFNSSYLSREYSERALSLLASTGYEDALSAGIPAGIPIAHKFGEAGTGDIERQLHDCGIVYFPNHPYLACIMTRGKDTETLKKSIVDISRFIYEKIDEQY